jgi:hypothetical protein
MTRAWLGPVIAESGGRLLAPSDEEAPDLFVVDLTSRGAPESILRARTSWPGVCVLAFGPHVGTAELRAAREAGADHVVARGAAASRVEKLIRCFPGPRKPDSPGTNGA